LRCDLYDDVAWAGHFVEGKVTGHLAQATRAATRVDSGPVINGASGPRSTGSKWCTRPSARHRTDRSGFNRSYAAGPDARVIIGCGSCRWRCPGCSGSSDTCAIRCTREAVRKSRRAQSAGRLLLAGLAIGLIATGCSRQKTIEPADPQAVTVGSIGEPKKLLPMLASDSASGDIAGLVFNGLVKYNPDLQLVGELAESFTVTPDCRQVDFTLRPHVKWQDGAPFTADDVQFTYQKMIDPKVATPYRDDFERVDSLKVIDPLHLRITYKQPFAPAVESWAMGMIPKHLLDGKDLNKSDLNRTPIGTGPYKMKEWTTGQRVVLEANPDYFEGQPKVARYIYRIIPDTATMFLELKSGGLDFMGLTPVLYQRQTDDEFFRHYYHKFRYPAFVYTYLGYNLKDPRFADVRVRRAFTMAINRQSVIDGVLLGLGRVATGPFPPESWAYNPDVKPLPYDPDKAKALLAEAGWKDTDGDGLLDKDGQPFAFTILTNQGNDERKKTAEIIQRDLKAIGVKVEIRVLEWQAFLHDFIDKKKFEAIILGWSLGRDPDAYDIWHSSKTAEGEFNFVSYNNPKVDELLVKGRQTCDHAERQTIYRELHRIMNEEQPYTFLYYPDATPILQQRFKGVKQTQLGIWWNFAENWYVPANKAEWYQ
jgi:peptide/nickel transport system substrate-binding protein